MKLSLKKSIAASVLLSLAGLGGTASAAECIAPANPGGGWDFTCRTIGKIMSDIGAVDKPIQVTNMAGAGGGLAFNHVVAERNDDAELIVLTRGVLRLMFDSLELLAQTLVSSLWLKTARFKTWAKCLMQLKKTQVQSPLLVVQLLVGLIT